MIRPDLKNDFTTACKMKKGREVGKYFLLNMIFYMGMKGKWNGQKGKFLKIPKYNVIPQELEFDPSITKPKAHNVIK